MSIPLQSAPIDELFYNNYQYDALDYCADILKGLIDRYNTILNEPTTRSTISPKDKELYDKKLNILRYEIIAKVCHYAENLGAFAHAFTNSDKIKDIYKLVCNYEVNWVINFYKPFLRSTTDTLRNSEKVKIEKIFAYPEPTTISSKNKIDKSIINIRKLLLEIGSVYVGERDPNFKESYNSYKHEYRILPGIEIKNKIEVITYLAQDGKASFIPVDHRSTKIILDLKKYCRILFEAMLVNNRVKHNLIKRGISGSSEQIALIHKQRRDYKLINKKLHLTIRSAKSSNKKGYVYLVR